METGGRAEHKCSDLVNRELQCDLVDLHGVEGLTGSDFGFFFSPSMKEKTSLGKRGWKVLEFRRERISCDILVWEDERNARETLSDWQTTQWLVLNWRIKSQHSYLFSNHDINCEYRPLIGTELALTDFSQTNMLQEEKGTKDNSTQKEKNREMEYGM